MPVVPELPITMLACARLGVIHSVVFGGFSGEACGMRAADSGSKVLVTIDGDYRSGTMTDHKEKADIAVKTAKDENHKIEKVLVWHREAGKYASKTPMAEGRDFFVEDVLKKYAGQVVEPVPMPSEAPLFLMYTSGTTGRPKGCQHGTGGYLSYVAGTSKSIQDIHTTDVYWCMADIGWITGHSYIVYGPLALAATSVLFEGVPNYPDAGRPWRVAKRLNVNIFHTSPTAIRMLRKAGPDEPAKYNYHFKHMTTVGEPIEPEVWKWYHQVVGRGEAVIVDTWWQTETGGVLCSTKPALDPMKPGSAGPTFPGIYAAIIDENGNEVRPGSANAGVEKKIIEAIEHQIGKIARPRKVIVVPDMPKTRSGKIMRRVLAAISNQMDTGDVSTLANPDVVDQIRIMVQGKQPVTVKDVPEDLKRFGEER